MVSDSATFTTKLHPHFTPGSVPWGTPSTVPVGTRSRWPGTCWHLFFKLLCHNIEVIQIWKRW